MGRSREKNVAFSAEAKIPGGEYKKDDTLSRVIFFGGDTRI